MFKKFFFIILLTGSIFFLLLCNFFKMISVDLNFFFILELENWKIGSIFDLTTFSFIFMVIIVVALVSLYSELYMEHYNNKKFFILMNLFFSSMIFLSMSKSYLNLMIGWDFLGLTSIGLIMFYPNKITMANSILTMFFNRLGDVILIFIMSFLFSSYSNFYVLMDESEIFLMMCLLLCSFTKSAQFPLSAWLPAAMAAPTPISAMVHSSTLVTAGIFLMHKLMSQIQCLQISEIFCAFSTLTFLMGGLMALFEMDFKKIVAFSTMSQISMIMIFCSFNLIGIMLSHMIFHAFFKTLLFCCCGTFFLYNFSDQIYKYLKSLSKLMNYFFFLSIYSMSGLFFCSSFFTKDLVLEFLNEKSEIWFFFMMMGSIFTLLYSSKLMISCYNWLSIFKIFYNKKIDFKIIFLFSLVMMYSNKLIHLFLFPCLSPLVTWMDLSIILIVLNAFLLMKTKNIKYSNSMLNLTQNISFMKYFSFSIYKNLIEKTSLKSFSLNDEMFFKSNYLKIFDKKFKNLLKKNNLFPILFIAIMWMFYFF